MHYTYSLCQYGNGMVFSPFIDIEVYQDVCGGNSLKDLTVPLLVRNLMISTSNWESKTWLDTWLWFSSSFRVQIVL